MLIPVLEPSIPLDSILASVNGLLFTGSPSNVSPALYGGPAPREGTWLDERRDALTVPLLRAAITAGVPALCLCRGFQELNVAFGGTLAQHVHELPGRNDHREDKDAPLDVQYGPAHDVVVEPGGLLAAMTTEKRFRVNSLHSQGIERLSDALRIEAIAPDGQIEAVSMKSSKGFVFATQWHPEWRWSESPVSRAILAAFGNAVREHAQ